MNRIMMALSILALSQPVAARVKMCGERELDVSSGMAALRGTMPTFGSQWLYSGALLRDGALFCSAVYVLPAPWVQSVNFQHIAYLAAAKETVVIRMVDTSVPICMAELNSKGHLIETSLGEKKRRAMEWVNKLKLGIGNWWPEGSLGPGLDSSLDGWALPPIPPIATPETQYSCELNSNIYLYIFAGPGHICARIAHEITHGVLFIEGKPFQHCGKYLQGPGNSVFGVPVGCESVNQQIAQAESEAKVGGDVGIAESFLLPRVVLAASPDRINEDITQLLCKTRNAGTQGRHSSDTGDPAVAKRRRRHDESEDETNVIGVANEMKCATAEGVSVNDPLKRSDSEFRARPILVAFWA
jgi:hypothetical protein